MNGCRSAEGMHLGGGSTIEADEVDVPGTVEGGVA